VKIQAILVEKVIKVSHKQEIRKKMINILPHSIKIKIKKNRVLHIIYQLVLELKNLVSPLKSYSQFGEDAVLISILKLYGFNQHEKGFFIDIGAGHPIRGSNTYALYRMGWEGICVDAISYNIKLHKFFRRRDVALHAFVGQERIVNFWEFNPYEYSTADNKIAKDLIKNNVPLLAEYKLNAIPLNNIARMNKNENYGCTFLSIDAEGFDFEILQTNDWDQFRPKFICVEVVNNLSTINGLLSHLGYQIAAKTHVSEIWVDLKNK